MLTLRKALPLVLFPLVVLVAIGHTVAGVLIDSFETSGPQLTVSPAMFFDQGMVVGNGIIGQQREGYLQQGQAGEASLGAAGGYLTLQWNSGNGTPINLVIWDGSNVATQVGVIDANGLGNRDFTEGGATGIHFRGVSTTTSATIITLDVFQSGVSSRGSIIVPANTNNGNFVMPFADFVPPFDFTDTGALQLQFQFQSLTHSALIQVDEIRSDGLPVSVNGTSWSEIKALYGR